jgi:chromate transporter
MSLGKVPAVAALFYGLKPAVVAIVVEAVLRIGRKSLRSGALMGLAAMAFVAIYFLHVPFPAIVFAAGLIGYLAGEGLAGARAGVPAKSEADPPSGARGWVRVARTTALGLALWFLPIMVLGLWRGWDDILVDIGVLFSKAAVVTFGGAYAVLGYISQQAVSFHGWLLPEQMMDGLGLAETTPGPLIMVLQFVGFMGGWNHPGGLAPIVAATAGALLTTWVTFVPCFLWIFLGAPYIERLRGNVQLTAALSTITAAVVGVVLNLAVWFGMHALFPGGAAVDWFAVIVSLVAFIGMLRWRWDIIPVVLGAGALGLIYQLALLPHF